MPESVTVLLPNASSVMFRLATSRRLAMGVFSARLVLLRLRATALGASLTSVTLTVTAFVALRGTVALSVAITLKR